MVTVITLPHYWQGLEHPNIISRLMSSLGLERHAFERILYLAPIVWAGFLFGRRGAVVVSILALVAMLPRAIFISPFSRDALFESSAVFIVGNLVAMSFEWLRKERERRIQLSVLNRISGVASQSLDLSQVLTSSVTAVADAVKVDIALAFLLDEKASELVLAAHHGVSSGFVQSVGRLKLGEGLNGMVAETGEPLFVEDATLDPRVTKMAVREEGIRSELIVPLMSKGRVLGTLAVAMRGLRLFAEEDVELLTGTGNQIGVAVENARLYEQQRATTEQLRVSEERYRELFENAHDAIWIHDLDGNIVSANRAATKLSGYGLDEVIGMKAAKFLSVGSLALAREVRRKLLSGEAIDQPYEQGLVRKDGTTASLQMTTSLVLNEGRPVGFHHIVRDVTEEKRMRENLRFYLGQVTRAQEEERKRIARELHDETIQALVVLARQLDELASNSQRLSQEERVRLENLMQQTNNIMDGVRRLTQDLRPATLDRLGLLPALEWLAADVGRYSGLSVEVRVLGTERRLSAEAELLLFRIVQEALRNVWRHSQATQAEVMVEFEEGKTRVVVRDNGKGFDARSVGDLTRGGKLGLAGIQERARLLGGTVAVKSEPGKGTAVLVEAPV
ncbi:MAG: PAS domain S-box protein [Chloroflexota bacterium]